MNVPYRSALAAGLFLAVFGTTNVAYGGFEKFFISGNPVTCEAVFASLFAQHGIFHGNVKTEVVFDPVPNGGVTAAGVTTIGTQTAQIAMAGDEKGFDWLETTENPGPPPFLAQEGFDLVALKAGNGRSVYVYIPDETGGVNLSDLNTTRKITEALICSDDEIEPVTNLEACALSPGEVADVCVILGSDQFFVHRAPGDVAGTSICACSDLTASDCNAKPVCTGYDPTADPVCPGPVSSSE